jgi:hypothetical protein
LEVAVSKDKPNVRIYQMEPDDKVRLVYEGHAGKRKRFPWIWVALALLVVVVAVYYFTR